MKREKQIINEYDDGDDDGDDDGETSIGETVVRVWYILRKSVDRRT